jgi:hypothetical protein
MKNLLRKFILWVMGSGKTTEPAIVSSESYATNVEPKVRISFLKAINGTIIEVGSYKANPHGPDWKHELYIVREGENLGDAIKVILATKALEQ